MCMNDRSLDSSGLREVLTLRVMGVLTHLLLRQGSSPTGKNQPKDGIRGSLRWPYPTFIEREFGNLWGYLWLSQWLRVHLALGKQNLELLDDLPHEGHSGASSIFQDILVNRKFTYCLSLTLSQVYKSEVFLHGFNRQFFQNTTAMQIHERWYSVLQENLSVVICWLEKSCYWPQYWNQ